MNIQQTLWMYRAIQLAKKGQGYVSPNPMVGCVIVYKHRIIGEGWHRRYGGHHAEQNAISQVKDPTLLRHSTVYINLEPCIHIGHTPPCVDLLIRHQIRKIVIAHQDLNKKIQGKGIKKLQQAGIQVEEGLLKQSAYQLNKFYFACIVQKRPYIILKWAETQDGFIANDQKQSKWISSQYARTLVHQWRAKCDAVLVGTNTAHEDNPRLTVRHCIGKQPMRVVVDRHLRLSQNLYLFDQLHPTICYNYQLNQILHNLQYIQLSPQLFFEQLFKDLFTKKIQSILIEGGSQLLTALIRGGYWDEARVFVAPKQLQHGIKAPVLSIQPNKETTYMTDKLLYYYK